MEFRMLGPLEVREGSAEIRLGGAKQRRLLARLLVDRNRVVSLDSLVDALWGDALPSDPAHQVQVYVSQIRKALGPDGAALETAPPGYRLRTASQDVDLDRFERLAADARSAVAEGNTAHAVALCEQALGLWRGPFMHGFEAEEFVQADAVRAEARKSQVEIDRLTALLAEGRAEALIPELQARVAADPTDERSVLLLMRAFQLQGRQREAIEAFHTCRRALAEDMGVDPSPELQELVTKILRGDQPPVAQPALPEGVSKSEAGLQLVAHASRSRWVVGGVVALLVVVVLVAALLTRGPISDEIAALEPSAVGAIDPVSGRTVASLTLSVRPTRIAFGLGTLWITSASAGQLIRVDPETFSVRQEIDVGSGVGPIAFADSAVWVANVDDGTVSRIDPRTNEIVQTVSVGNGPSDMTAVGDDLWVAARLDAAVVKIDSRQGRVVQRVPVGAAPGGLVATEDSLWVSDELSSAAVQVDLETEQVVSTVHVGSGPGPLAASGDDVWVVNRFDETVSHIGPSGSVEATVALGHGLSGVVAVDGVPWVAYQDGIERIDAEAGVSGGVVTTGAAAIDLTSGADRVWVVTGPSLAEHVGGTLRLLTDSVDSLDPAQAYQPESWRVLFALNDGLVAYGGPGRSIVANLALRVPPPSDGGKTYAFRLRDGIRYSNGEQVRPEDVRHSFERLLGNGGPAAPLYSAITGAQQCLEGNGGCDLSAGIVASEKTRTVTFRLTRADPEFMAKLALPPASLVPATVPADTQKTVPSTGPYELVEHTAKQIVLERRDDFEPWAVAAQSAGFAERIVVDMDHAGAPSRAVVAGEADWTDVSGSDVSALHRRYGSQIHEFPRPAIIAVFLNTTVAPFDDVDVRQALNFAVDREVVQRAFGGPDQATITCQVLPPGAQGFEPYCPYSAAPGSGQWRAPDLARAKRLLNGKDRVAVTVHGFADVAPSVRHIAAVLRELGYPARAKILPIERFFELATTGPDIQAGLFAWFGDTPGASGFIAPNFQCVPSQSAQTSNYARHCDPAVDRLSEQASRLQFSDPQRANDVWARVDRRLTDSAAWVPLVNPKGIELVSKRLGNYTYDPVTGMILSEVWVD